MSNKFLIYVLKSMYYMSAAFFFFLVGQLNYWQIFLTLLNIIYLVKAVLF